MFSLSLDTCFSNCYEIFGEENVLGVSANKMIQSTVTFKPSIKVVKPPVTGSETNPYNIINTPYLFLGMPENVLCGSFDIVVNIFEE